MMDILTGDEKPNKESEPYGIKWTERTENYVKLTLTQPIQCTILDIAKKMGYNTEFFSYDESGIFANISDGGKHVAEIAGNRILYDVKDSDMRRVVFEYGKSLDVKTKWNKYDNTLLRIIGCK